MKKADKAPHNYDRTPFSLHGRMDLDVTFGGVTMCTPIYIKTDAQEQLLLSEGVCRQLNIVQYHAHTRPKSRVVKGRQICQDCSRDGTQDKARQVPVEDAVVPTVTVSLIESVRVLPGQSATAIVKIDKVTPVGNSWLLESSTEELSDQVGVQIEDYLVDPSRE